MTTLLGTQKLGNVAGGGGARAFRILWSDSPPEILFPPSPILELFEITSASGNIERLVDFGDLEASDTPGQVTFDGDEYTTIKVQHTPIEESAEGGAPEITFTIFDYDHSIVGWINDNDGLVGATVDVHFIAYEDIGTPSAAITRTFRVARVMASQGPATVSVTLGSPDLDAFEYPSIVFQRDRCHNEWQQRFTHDDKNHCPFPSCEFELITKQVFDTTVAAETEKEHGFYQLNCDRATQAQSGIPPNSGDDYVLYVTGSNDVDDCLWDGTSRNGIFIFKKISGDVLNLDVSTKLYCYAPGSHDDAICGILVQSQDDPTTWIFWGIQNNGGTPRYLCRVTDASVSTDYTYAGSYSAFRLERYGSGDAWWNLQVRDEDVTSREISSGSWLNKGYVELDFGSSELNVGLVFALDETSGGNLTFAFESYYLRFFGGGTEDCDGSFSACLERGNYAYFNAFQGMPDAYRR